ncbi:MAG: tetratricopeptide repeat protein [Spirochaetes bacterium]|nr:tetratricopeptide repeat protein [Spirochaetota bacterium]
MFRKIFIYSTAVLILSVFSGALAESEDARLQELLKLAERPPAKEDPAQTLYSKGDIILCEGQSEAAIANNRAASMMDAGDFAGAQKALDEALKHAPHFFAFRYNIGICFIHLNKTDLALMNLEKASNIFPEYFKTYIQIGYIYQIRRKDDAAIIYYRKALEKNPRAGEVFVLIGDIYLERNQLEMAGRYYQAALDLNPKNPNAQLGQVKIHYLRKEYYRAITIIKYIPLAADYDKSLHYFYAECAYKLRDYQTAHAQYNMLLTFKSDRFFITNSVALIKHKIDLCSRFIEVQER